MQALRQQCCHRHHRTCFRGLTAAGAAKTAGTAGSWPRHKVGAPTRNPQGFQKLGSSLNKGYCRGSQKAFKKDRDPFTGCFLPYCSTFCVVRGETKKGEGPLKKGLKQGPLSPLQPSYNEFSIFPLKTPIFPRKTRLFYRKYAKFIIGGL